MQIYIKEQEKHVCCKKKSQSQPKLNVIPQSSQTSMQDLKQHYINRSRSLDSAGKSGKIPKEGSKESEISKITDPKSQNSKLRRSTASTYLDQCESMKEFCKKMKLKAEELQQDLDGKLKEKRKSNAIKGSSSTRIEEKLKLMQEICQSMRKRVSDAAPQPNNSAKEDKNFEDDHQSLSFCDRLSKIKQAICKLAAEDYEKKYLQQSRPKPKKEPPGKFQKFVEAFMDKKSKYHKKDNEKTIETASDIAFFLEERGINCILYTAGYTPEEVKELVNEQLSKDEEIQKSTKTLHKNSADQRPIFKISACHNNKDSYFTSLKTNAANIIACIRDIVKERKVAFVILY